MRKRSGQNFEELVTLKDLHGLNKLESADLIAAYKKAEQKPGAGVSFYDLIQILRSTFPLTKPTADASTKTRRPT